MQGSKFGPTKLLRLLQKEFPLVAQVLSVTRSMSLSLDGAGSCTYRVFLVTFTVTTSLRRRCWTDEQASRRSSSLAVWFLDSSQLLLQHPPELDSVNLKMEAAVCSGKQAQTLLQFIKKHQRKYSNLHRGSDNQQTGNQVPLCAVRHRMYLYTVKYSNFTRISLYIYIYLRGTRYVTAGLQRSFT